MSTASIVRSAMYGSRRNSKCSDLRRTSFDGQLDFAITTSVNVDTYLYGGSTILPRKKKPSSDDEEDEDECNIDALESHTKPQPGISPLASEGETRRKSIDEGVAGGRLRPRKASSAAADNEDDNAGPAPTPPPDDVTNGEDWDLEDSPWYLQVLDLVMKLSIDPDGLLYFYWKTFLTLAVMYNYVIIILRIAFEELRNEPLFSHLDMMCDVMYLIDFMVESKSCYLSNGSLITDSRLTLQHYLGKNKLVMDIVAVLPLRIFIATSAGLCSIFGSPIIFLEKYYYVIEPTFRLNRLAKTHVMNSFFYKTESRTNSPNLLRAVRLGIQLALVIHWMACLYYMISEYEGLGSSDWAYPSDPQYNNFQRKYIVSMYWSIMTLTTIGERPSPVTSLEYIFTGLTFLIGVFVFAAVVGNVGDVISNMNAARRDFQNRMDQIKFYLNHRQVPEVLQTRIKRWAEYTWDRTKAVDEPSVLQWLPDRLRTEVAIYVHLSVLKKVSIFDECEEGLLRELVLKLKPQIYSPGDYICRIGEIGREMYIINHGQVEILFPDVETGAMRQVAVMNPGNFFGEISLLKLDDGQNKRTADVRSIGFSELLCLSRRDLMVALTEYPDAKRILEEYARERFQQTKKQSQSRTASPNPSPRESVVSTPNSPISAKQVFARVMKKEGFASLLKRKDTDLMAIKAAVDELKATSSSEVHNTFVSLHKEIQDMGRQLLQKDMEMQHAKAEISYLKSIISNRFNPPNLPNGTSNGTHSNHTDEGNTSPPVSPDSNGISIANPCLGSPTYEDMGRYRRQFLSQLEESPTHNPSEQVDAQNNYYKISFLGNSQDVLEITCESKDSDKPADAVDSSFNSSDDDSSDEDNLESIEEKFDNIGRDGIYKSNNSNMSNKRSVSMNVLSELSNQYPNHSEAKFEPRRKASFQANTPLNLNTSTQPNINTNTSTQLSTSASDSFVEKMRREIDS